MTLKNKIIVSIVILVIFGLSGVILYQRLQMKKQTTLIENSLIKQKELSNELMRSQSEYAKKQDIEKFIKDNNLPLNDIKNDLKKLQAEISSVNQVQVHSTGTHQTNLPSTNTGEINPNPSSNDTYEYLKSEQKLKLNEKFANMEVPIGEVGFSAWKEKPWMVNILPRTYTLTTVVGIDENQRQIYYNKLSVRINNKDYDIQISKAETKQVVPSSKLNWWNPKVLLGVNGGLNINQMKPEANTALYFNFINYGKYHNSPDWMFVSLGLGYNFVAQQPSFNLNLFNYNIKPILPILNNTYLGTNISVDIKGNFSPMIGITVGL